MFENNLIAGSAGQSTGFYPYAINQSLRFNDDDSAYLERTPATAGNRKTWTWSGWIKRGNLGFEQTFFGAHRDGNNYIAAQFDSDDTLNITYKHSNQSGGSVAIQIRRKITTQVFRDSSSWYHVVISFDASNTNCDIYVNGSEVTSFSVNEEPQNLNFEINNISTHYLSTFQNSRFTLDVTYFDGYLAEINFIDGQALDPTSFGEFKSGVWVAKEYTGTYGTNGFYLPFENGLGNDESGNGNDWTPNNLAATDIVLDSPTNNFATLNPLHRNSVIINGYTDLSQGNLFSNTDGNDNREASGTLGVTSGKYYFEAVRTQSDGGGDGVGVHVNSAEAIYRATGNFRYDGSESSYGATWGNGDIIGVAIDLDNTTIEFFKNGVSQGDAKTDLPEGTYLPLVYNRITNTTIALNFGQDSSFAGNETAQGNTDENGIGDFYYTPPAGFLALCTANLPEPAISPADDESPGDYFGTLLWTGDNASPRTIATGESGVTGDINFQPDWVWIKRRSSAKDHALFDAVRGSTLKLESNNTNAEIVGDQGKIDSFTTDGFIVSDGTTDNSQVNISGSTYVAWNWKANGSGVSNTDGSITSTVSASPESGFSIVSYTGTGANATVGHGLDSALDMVIVKGRDSTFDWVVWHNNLSGNEFLILNKTDPVGSASAVWNSAIPSSSVFSLGSNLATNENADPKIAYCFHSVEGYSKFGSYTGNGSTDGPFVYTGFRPAFVMVKRTDSTSNWHVLDAARDPDNSPTYQILYPNLSNSEDSSSGFVYEFLSNGFKWRNTSGDINASGGTYIYMAFAENPFKYSLAR